MAMSSKHYSDENNETNGNPNGNPNGDAKDASESFVPIAVCGMALRLPGGISNPSDFWEFLLNKGDGRGRVPPSRYDTASHCSPFGRDGMITTEHGYYLDVDPGELDTSFFSFTKAELEYIDPHQRHLLEVVYECFESAGEVNYRGANIGCYVGSYSDDWIEILFHDLQMYGKYPTAMGADYAIPNRISFEYDLRGPSASIRTACSSTMVALTQACSAIARGECDSAIVGGCQFILSPTMGSIMSARGLLSSDGACKSFDASADGYGRGEAINAVYLKPLDAALRDRNPIRAIIKGSAVNSDGKSAGFTVPSAEAQGALIRKAYRLAGIENPSETVFVECHGTGTTIGDPIETSVIAQIHDQEVFVGSVKPNVGHSEGASGLTSFIKAILAVENSTIPPNIRFKTPNPKIPFRKGGLSVATEPIPWPSDRPLRAGINCFGLGGVNVHTVLESAATLTLSQPRRLMHNDGKPSLLLFSANTQESLTEVIKKNLHYVEKHPEALSDLSYTLGLRRVHLPFRAFSVVSDNVIIKTSPLAHSPGQHQDIVMVFTGQGAQWPGMGAQLYETNQTFRKSLQEADRVIHELPESPGWFISEEIRKDATKSNLRKASYSQPICTAVQVALVDMLKELHVYPSAVIGHSSGELAAAYASGRLTAREAIICAFYRGLVSGEVTKSGSMAAIGMGAREIKPFLTSGTVVACENSPTSITISGDSTSMEEVMTAVRKSRPDVLVRILEVDTAYHSPLMKEVGDRYKTLMDGHLSKSNAVPERSVLFTSSVTGGPLRTSEVPGSEYWQQNLEQPVLFSQGIQAIMESFDKQLLFLEVGPHSALSGPLRQIFDHKSSDHQYLSCMSRFKPCSEFFLSLVGQLYTESQPLNLSALIDPDGSCNVLTDVPTYAWNHSVSNIYQPRSIKEWKKSKYPRHELLGARVTYSTDDQACWRNVLFYHHVPWLHEHRVTGNAVFPAAGYFAMVVEAVRQLSDTEEPGFQIRNAQLGNAMVLSQYNTAEIITSLRKRSHGAWYDFNISSHNGAAWVEHCAGQVKRGSCFPAPLTGNKNKDLSRSIDATAWYRTLAGAGVDYGASFRGIRTLRCSVSEHFASAEVVSTLQDTVYYPLHPTKLDACLQTAYASTYQGLDWKIGQLPVPTYFGEVNILDCDEDLTCYISSSLMRKGVIGASAEIYAPDGRMVVHLANTVIRPLGLQNPTDGNRAIGTRLHWEKSIDFLRMDEHVSSPPDWKDSTIILSDLGKACIKESLARLDEQRVSVTVPHLEKYEKWLRAYQQPYGQNGETVVREDLVTEALASPAAPCAAAMLKVVNNLAAMCRGEIDPVEVLLSDSTLLEMYDYLNSVDRGPLFKALGHHHPTQRILEIGAGTGGTTAKIIKETMYSTYTFTDISAAFFPAAKERFKSHPNMVFKTLDISKDPAIQGFLPESFDLIIASNVLHATSSLQETLRHVRQLLHPHGKLLLEELCGEVKYANIITGVLSGWWAGEKDGRDSEPYVSPERWDRELQRAGFGGLDDVAFDAAPPFHNMAYMLARPQEINLIMSQKTVLLADADSTEIAIRLQKQLRSRGYEVAIQGIREPLPSSSDAIVVIDTAEPFFHDLNESELCDFQHFLRGLQHSHSGALWVTRSSQIGCKDPRYASTIGVARTSRAEFGIDFATCEVDTMDYNGMSLVIDVYEQFRRRDREDPLLRETEYVINEGAVYVGRMLPFSMENEMDKPGHLAFERAHSRLSFNSNTEKWVSHTRQLTLGADEVEVEVDTAGVSYRDVIAFVDPTLPSETGIGLDAAGVVRRVGSQITDLSRGDRVVVIYSGCFSTSVVVKRERCARIPRQLSLKDASTMPLPFLTALYSLIDVGGLRESQTVLIHSASGGVGSAAIQVSQMLGACVYATVGSNEKADYIQQTYKIPKNRIFDSSSHSFVSDLKQATAGRGVDLVLHTLPAEFFTSSCECLALDGKLINLDKVPTSEETHIPSKLLRNISVIPVDVIEYIRTRPQKGKQLLERVFGLYCEGKFQPLTPTTTYLPHDVANCLNFMQTRQHVGKILLSFQDGEGLPDPSRPTESMIFRSDASYLLVGGLGGLGCGLARWMVENNARHLIFLSRSADTVAEIHQPLFNELRDKGCSITAIQGSVCKLVDVEKAVAAAPAPVKGIFNLSMLLQDASLLTMTLAEWKGATEPKVRGTWNLHAATQHIELDFFVLFGSLGGMIGKPGQANYASANTFMDGFVQYRHHQHLPASVIDIGAVEGIGHVAENPQVLERTRWLNGAALSQRELFQAVTLAVQAPHPGNDSEYRQDVAQASHIITGFRSTPEFNEALRNKASFLDRRLAIFANLDAENTSANDQSAGSNKSEATLRQFVKTLPTALDKLDDPATGLFLAKAIAAWMFDLLLKPVEEDSEIDLSRSLVDVGFDSLAAVELRTWWRANLSLEISVLEIMSSANLEALGEYAVRGLKDKFMCNGDKK